MERVQKITHEDKTDRYFPQRKAAEPVIKTCILWTLLCAVLLMGMCRKADSHVLCPEESIVLLRLADDAGRQDFAWARESMGQQRIEMTRPGSAERVAAGRYVRTAEVFCLDLSASLPELFNLSRRMYYAAEEDAAKLREYKIPFMHDLDGRKRLTI